MAIFKSKKTKIKEKLAVGNADDLDFDNFDDMDFSDDDDIFGDSSSAKSRTPVSSVTRGVIKGAKSAILDHRSHLEAVFKELPDSVETTYETFVRGSGDIADEIRNTAREIKPELGKIARGLDALIPSRYTKLKSKTTKLKDKFKDEEYDTVSESRRREDAIAQELNAIFTAQASMSAYSNKRQEAMQMINNKIDQKRHGQQLQQLDQLNASMSMSNSYNTKVAAAYQRKMLETQLRSLYVQTDTLSTIRQDNKEVKTFLGGILKNTSLPDYAKLTETERLKSVFRKEIYDKTSKGFSSATDFITNVIKSTVGNIKQKGVDYKDVFSMVGDMLEDYAMVNDEDTDLLEGGIAFGSGLGVKAIINHYIKKGIKKADVRNNSFFNEKVFPFTRKVLNPEKYLNQFKDKMDDAEWSGNLIYSTIAKLLTPLTDAIDENSGRKTSVNLKENQSSLLAASYFNKITQMSITKIIPGFLSRILQQNTRAANLSQFDLSNKYVNTDLNRFTPEMMMYNLEKGEFTTRSELVKYEQKKFDEASGYKEHTQAVQETIGALLETPESSGSKKKHYIYIKTRTEELIGILSSLKGQLGNLTPTKSEKTTYDDLKNELNSTLDEMKVFKKDTLDKAKGYYDLDSYAFNNVEFDATYVIDNIVNFFKSHNADLSLEFSYGEYNSPDGKRIKKTRKTKSFNLESLSSDIENNKSISSGFNDSIRRQEEGAKRLAGTSIGVIVSAMGQYGYSNPEEAFKDSGFLSSLRINYGLTQRDIDKAKKVLIDRYRRQDAYLKEKTENSFNNIRATTKFAGEQLVGSHEYYGNDVSGIISGASEDQYGNRREVGSRRTKSMVDILNKNESLKMLGPLRNKVQQLFEGDRDTQSMFNKLLNSMPVKDQNEFLDYLYHAGTNDISKIKNQINNWNQHFNMTGKLHPEIKELSVKKGLGDSYEEGPTVTSDRLLKNIKNQYNVNSNSKGQVSMASKIAQIPTYNFTYKQDPDQKLHFGPMAQDVNKILGNQFGPDGKKLDVGSMLGALTQATGDTYKHIQDSYHALNMSLEGMRQDNLKATIADFAIKGMPSETIKKILEKGSTVKDITDSVHKDYKKGKEKVNEKMVNTYLAARGLDIDPDPAVNLSRFNLLKKMDQNKISSTLSSANKHTLKLSRLYQRAKPIKTLPTNKPQSLLESLANHNATPEEKRAHIHHVLLSNDIEPTSNEDVNLKWFKKLTRYQNVGNAKTFGEMYDWEDKRKRSLRQKIRKMGYNIKHDDNRDIPELNELLKDLKNAKKDHKTLDNKTESNKRALDFLEKYGIEDSGDMDINIRRFHKKYAEVLHDNVKGKYKTAKAHVSETIKKPTSAFDKISKLVSSNPEETREEFMKRVTRDIDKVLDGQNPQNRSAALGDLLTTLVAGGVSKIGEASRWAGAKTVVKLATKAHDFYKSNKNVNCDSDVYLGPASDVPVILKIGYHTEDKEQMYFDQKTGNRITSACHIRGPVVKYDHSVVFTQEQIKEYGLYVRNVDGKFIKLKSLDFYLRVAANAGVKLAKFIGKKIYHNKATQAGLKVAKKLGRGLYKVPGIHGLTDLGKATYHTFMGDADESHEGLDAFIYRKANALERESRGPLGFLKRHVGKHINNVYGKAYMAGKMSLGDEDMDENTNLGEEWKKHKHEVFQNRVLRQNHLLDAAQQMHRSGKGIKSYDEYIDKANEVNKSNLPMHEKKTQLSVLHMLHHGYVNPEHLHANSPEAEEPDDMPNTSKSSFKRKAASAAIKTGLMFTPFAPWVILNEGRRAFQWAMKKDLKNNGPARRLGALYSTPGKIYRVPGHIKNSVMSGASYIKNKLHKLVNLHANEAGAIYLHGKNDDLNEDDRHIPKYKKVDKSHPFKHHPFYDTKIDGQWVRRGGIRYLEDERKNKHSKDETINNYYGKNGKGGKSKHHLGLLGGLLDSAKNMFSGLIGDFGSVLRDGLMAGGVFEAAKALGSRAIGGIKDIAEKVAKYAGRKVGKAGSFIWNKGKDALKAIKGLFTKGGAADDAAADAGTDVAADVGTGVAIDAGADMGVAGGLEAAGAAADATGVGLPVGAVLAVAGGLAALYGVFHKQINKTLGYGLKKVEQAGSWVLKKASSVWKTIKHSGLYKTASDVVDHAGDMIESTDRRLGSWLSGGHNYSISGAIGHDATQVGKGVVSAFDTSVHGIVKGFDYVKSKVMSAADWLEKKFQVIAKPIENAFKTVSDDVKAFGSDLSGAMKWLINHIPGLKTVINIGKHVVHVAKKDIHQAAKDVGHAAHSVWNDVTGAWDSITGDVKKLPKTIEKKTVSTVTTISTEPKGWFKHIRHKSDAPLGIKNNNPGMITIWDKDKHLPIVKGYVKFSTPEQGLIALGETIKYFISKGQNTLPTLLKALDLPAYTTDPTRFLSQVESISKFTVTSILKADAATLIALINSITQVQFGHRYYRPDIIAKAVKTSLATATLSKIHETKPKLSKGQIKAKKAKVAKTMADKVTKSTTTTSTVATSTSSGIGNMLLGGLTKGIDSVLSLFGLKGPNLSQVQKGFKSFASGVSKVYDTAENYIAKGLRMIPDLFGRVKKLTEIYGIPGMTSFFESRGNPATISPPNDGDYGGRSYGAFQLASNGNEVEDFVNSIGHTKQGKLLLKAGPVNSAGFNSMWVKLGNTDPEFAKQQANYNMQMYYVPIMNNLKSNGFDFSKSALGVKATMDNIANQFGPGWGSQIVASALHGQDMSTISDKKSLTLIYDYVLNNIPHFFRSSTAEIRKGVTDRYVNEKGVAIKLCDHDIDSTGKVVKKKTKDDKDNKPIPKGSVKAKPSNIKPVVDKKKPAPKKVNAKKEANLKPKNSVSKIPSQVNTGAMSALNGNYNSINGSFDTTLSKLKAHQKAIDDNTAKALQKKQPASAHQQGMLTEPVNERHIKLLSQNRDNVTTVRKTVNDSVVTNNHLSTIRDSMKTHESILRQQLIVQQKQLMLLKHIHDTTKKIHDKSTDTTSSTNDKEDLESLNAFNNITGSQPNPSVPMNKGGNSNNFKGLW